MDHGVTGESDDGRIISCLNEAWSQLGGVNTVSITALSTFMHIKVLERSQMKDLFKF